MIGGKTHVLMTKELMIISSKNSRKIMANGFVIVDVIVAEKKDFVYSGMFIIFIAGMVGIQWTAANVGNV